jgi:hypothetical protein
MTKTELKKSSVRGGWRRGDRPRSRRLRDASTRVDTIMAIALCESWKPLRKSKARARTIRNKMLARNDLFEETGSVHGNDGASVNA